MPDLNTFDFMITDEGDVMLVMFARDIEPHENPAVILYPDDHVIEFYRSDTEAMTLEEVDDDVFKNLENEPTLLVCEINPDDSENPEEAEIVYAYEAEIIRDLSLLEAEAKEASATQTTNTQPDGPQYPHE